MNVALAELPYSSILLCSTSHTEYIYSHAQSRCPNISQKKCFGTVGAELYSPYAIALALLFSVLTLLVGRQEGRHLACKKLGVGWQCDWSFARLIAPVVTTTSIILNSNKKKPANLGLPWKMAVQMDRCRCSCLWGMKSLTAELLLPFLLMPVSKLVSWCFTALSAQIGYIMP